MNQEETKASEKYVANQFNKFSKRFDEGDEKGLSKTGNEHISQISKDETVKTAIDVGSGAGGILAGLLDRNLDFVYGVDLAPKMVAVARQRLEKKGYSEKSDVENISFLDFSFENKHLDAVSLHQVLCCHPDRQAMLSKAISAKPKIIVLTIPRRRLILRFTSSVLGLLRKVKPGFRFYVHNIKNIDFQLAQENYELLDSFKTFFWNTRSYRLKNSTI